MGLIPAFKLCSLPHLIATLGIVTVAISLNIEGFVQNPPVFYSVAILQLVGQTWQPLFTTSASSGFFFLSFALNIKD